MQKWSSPLPPSFETWSDGTLVSISSNPTIYNQDCVLVCVCVPPKFVPMCMYVLLWQRLTLAGVSLAVSESDQRCLSWEELGTHSQNVCMGQTDRATSVGICSSHMCSRACKHMRTNTRNHTFHVQTHTPGDTCFGIIGKRWSTCTSNESEHASAHLRGITGFTGLRQAQRVPEMFWLFFDKKNPLISLNVSVYRLSTCASTGIVLTVDSISDKKTG